MASDTGSRRVAKQRQWRATLVRWRRSGLSVRQFCRDARISEALFYYWKRTLAAGAPAAASTRSTARRASAQCPAQPRLLPLEIVSAASGQGGVPSGIEISWPDGLRVRMSPAVNAENLTHVLRAIEAMRGGSSPC